MMLIGSANLVTCHDYERCKSRSGVAGRGEGLFRYSCTGFVSNTCVFEWTVKITKRCPKRVGS